jgi:hypothetical protein
MSLKLVNLDNKTRQYMLEEIDLDISNPQRFYISPRLSSIGRHDYPILLREATEMYDDE